MKRKQALIAALACAVFILDGLTIAGCWLRTHGAETRLEHAHQVIEHLENMESAAQSLGGYCRRYVSTASPSSLQDYFRTENKVQGLLKELGALLRDDDKMRLSLVGLRSLIAQRLDWERSLLLVYKTDGKEKALALLQAGGGVTVMERIRSQLSDMEITAKALLQKSSADYQLYRTGSLVAVLFLTIAGGMALWQAIKMSSRSVRLEADQVLAYERLELMNKQLNRQVSELLQSQKDANNALVIRSQFLARISHELRTPLTGIIGTTELALENLQTDDNRELIQTAHDSGIKLLEQVNAILDFEKLEQQSLQLQPAAFDLHLAIRSALEPLKMRAKEKGITFRVDVDPDTPHLVYADRLRIQQVLANLVDNAIKFTNQGDVTVVVTVSKRDSSRVVCCFTITDTGCGIDTEMLAPIWEPFNQADGFSTRQYAGSGLGLSISKKLVELLQGEIGVSSEPRRGSQFFFKIPLELRETESVESEPQMPVTLTKVASILVVDDNLTICKVTEAQLKKLGCQVDIATSGLEAVALTTKKRFDLILMDIQMPGMDGIQTVKTIRSAADNLCREVPVIAHTAHAMPGDEDNFLAAGLSGYLAKPVVLEALRKTLAKWILSEIRAHNT